jgi:general secretion pathway protein K
MLGRRPLAALTPGPCPTGVGEPAGSRGAALLMALFVAAIATVIVSGLFWRQFVLVRTIENQQLMSQSRLLLRGALDWARAILREDALTTTYDALSQPWAQPLAETRLDNLGESSALASQALMSGSIEDAQSRLNLRNLIGGDGSRNEAQVAVLAKLASELSLPEPTADLISAYVAQSTGPPPIISPTGQPIAVQPTGAQPGNRTQPLPLVFPDDLARVPGLDPAVAPRLAPYVVMLDEPTPVNFNTAPAELIAAEIPDLSLADARALVADRDRIPFINPGDISTRLRSHGASLPNGVDVSVASRYFFIHGEIKLQRADTRMEALVKRPPRGSPLPVDIVWEREI